VRPPPDGTAPSARVLLLTIVATLATMAVAMGLKSWCGVPAPDTADLYLRWCYSDIPPLFFAERLDVGAVPYLDHPVEYPVLTGAWMWLAALPVTSVAAFFWLTTLLLIAAAVATTVLLAGEVGPARAMMFAAAPTLAISGVVNWDLPAVLLATGGLVAHRRGRDGLAGALLGLGTAAKLFPGLFLLVLVPAAWRLRGRRAGLATGLVAAVVWWAVNAPIALAAPDSWLRFFELSRDRPADWDSLYTLLANTTGTTLGTTTVGVVSAVLLGAAAIGLGVVARRRIPPHRWHHLALPLLIAFLLTSKVYSPQFSIWLLPLFALSFPRWGWLAAFAVTDVAVTITRFPYLAGFLGDGPPGAWSYAPFGLAVTARAIVLTAVAVLAVRRLLPTAAAP